MSDDDIEAAYRYGKAIERIIAALDEFSEKLAKMQKGETKRGQQQRAIYAVYCAPARSSN